MIYDTSDTVQRWSSDTVRRWSLDIVWRWSLDIVRRWSSDTFRHWGSESGPALVLGCKRYLECSPALELGRKRTLPPGNNFKTEVWHKNDKALIKARNLKGLLGYPTCKLAEYISAILKIEDEKIC